MTTETPATAEIEKWFRIRFHFFHKFLTPGPKEKRRILPELTPALRIWSHLWQWSEVGNRYFENSVATAIAIRWK